MKKIAKLRIHFDVDEWLAANLEAFKANHPELETLKDLVQSYIQSLLAEKVAAVAVASVQSPDSPSKVEQPRPPQAQTEEAQVPFEAPKNLATYRSLYPIHPSRLVKLNETNSLDSQTASTTTTEILRTTNTDTIALSPKQMQALAFEKEKLKIKLLLEQEKRETARQIRFRRPQQRPVMNPSEPDTHAAPYWE